MTFFVYIYSYSFLCGCIIVYYCCLRALEIMEKGLFSAIRNSVKKEKEHQKSAEKQYFPGTGMVILL